MILFDKNLNLKPDDKIALKKKAQQFASLEKKATRHQKMIHKGKIISLMEEHVEYDNQNTQNFDLIIHPGAVALIPIDQEGNLLLVEQWRRAIKKILLELPAGTLEKGEDPKVCAQRELREETGFFAKKLQLLGGFFTSPGFCTEYISLYLAQDLQHRPLIGDDTLHIDCHALSLEEVLKKIEKGEIMDMKTIAGIYHWMKWVSS